MSDVPGSHSGQCKAIDFRIRHTGMFPHIPSGRYVPAPFQGCYNGITTMGAGVLGNADWILLYGTNNSRNPAPKNMKHLIILIIFFMIHNLLKISIQQNSLQSIFT